MKRFIIFFPITFVFLLITVACATPTNKGITETALQTIKKASKVLKSDVEILDKVIKDATNYIIDKTQKKQMKKMLHSLNFANNLQETHACGSKYTARLVKNNWSIIDFTQSCINHDNCYSTCGERKKSCDDNFKTDLFKACDKAKVDATKNRSILCELSIVKQVKGCDLLINKTLPRICESLLAKAYVSAVDDTFNLANSAWEKAQKEACKKN